MVSPRREWQISGDCALLAKDQELKGAKDWGMGGHSIQVGNTWPAGVGWSSC